MLDRQQRIDILADFARSSALAAPQLYPDRFHRPFDDIHREMFTVMDRKTDDPLYKPLKCVIAPRGVGKTSSSVLLKPSVSICLQDYDYIVIIGHNAGDAIEKTEELKRKLVTSPLIHALYGDIKTKYWAKDEYILDVGGKPIKIHPRGSGQPVRGRLFYDSRPGLVLVDDLEKSQETESEEQRQKRKDWFYGDVLNCIDRGLKHVPGEPPPWEIIVVGTILHQDSLLMNLHESEHWDSVLLEICDDNFVSNAPHFMTNADCKQLYQELKADDQLGTWYKEYRNNPSPTGQDAAFQPKFFNYYRESDFNLNLNPNVESVVIVDPSRTANFSSNPTGIVGVGVDTTNNKLYVRDCISARMHPEQMFDEIARMIKMLQARVLAVEVTGLHEFITHPLKTFLSERGIHVEFMELHARQGANEKGKVARVRALVPFYRQGLVYHNELRCDVLEQQLGAFPTAKEWSVMDPLGYIVEILEKGERYMRFPGDSDLKSRADIEREFQELEAIYANAPPESTMPLDDFRVFN